MLNFQLSPCRLCGGTSQEVEVSQANNQLWLPTIHCGGCEMSFTPFYAQGSSEDALAHVAERWNQASRIEAGADRKRIAGFEVRLLPESDGN
jgi:hypothetical protein